MDLCTGRLTAGVRCVSCYSSSTTSREVAFLQQGTANSLVLRQVPISPTLKHKAQAACISSCVSVRCQAAAASSAEAAAEAAPNGRPVMIDGGGGGMDTSLLTPVYLDFLQKMSFSNSRDSCYPEQLDSVAARVNEIAGSYLPEKYIKAGAGFGNLLYSYHSLDLQAKIGHFTAMGLLIDDLTVNLTGPARKRYLEDMRLFQMKFTDPEGYARLYPGRGKLHEVLERFMVYLRTDQNPFFPTQLRLHSLLIKSMFDLIEGNLLEQHYQEHPVEYSAHMPQFPRFLRYKSGMSEIFAYFVIMQTSSSGSPSQDELFFYDRLYPMVPDLIDAIDFVNDVMSLYKELRQGEDSIAILTHSRIHNLSLLQSLQDRVEAVILCRTRLLALADRPGCDAIKDRIVTFFQGYMSWHFGIKRYRLDEILCGWYNGGVWA
uniref:Terpine synthase-like protein MTPSL2 n=1 Tax=Anthoceros punctatus TaxID=3234 RepID=A0A2P1ED60_ANTPU|nr:terpine synthase-like protein MTPSL2 [Anthoceros punctatus]